MKKVETRGKLEQIVLDLIADRGWAVTGSERCDHDLDVFIDAEGTPGRLRFRSRFVDPSQSIDADRYLPFVRLDLGTPADEPELWAATDDYERVLSHEGGVRYFHGTVTHAAMGEGWASMTVSVEGNVINWEWQVASTEAMLGHAVALHPGADAAARRDHLQQMAKKTADEQEGEPEQNRLGYRMAPIFILAVIGAATTAITWHEASPSAAKIFAGVYTLFALGLIAAGWRLWRKKPPRTIEHTPVAIEALSRKLDMDDHIVEPAYKRTGLAVVCTEASGLNMAIAKLDICRFKSRSNRHELKAVTDVHRVLWPEGTTDECRILPRWWARIEIHGPPDRLNKLPPGPREKRYDGHVCWTLTGEEVERGDAMVGMDGVL